MALTVNLKPAGFRPVGGGELIYKFTEATIVGKPNYRVELEFNGLGLPKFEFRPDSALIIQCDIAPILRSVLALSALTTDRLKNTYVMYQAVWTGGSDAQVALNTDVIYFYVGNNHWLNNRTKFHTTATDGQAGPPFAPYPAGVALHHVIPSSESTASFAATENEGYLGWLNKQFIFEFLHDNTSAVNCEVTFTSPAGVDTTTAFAGNVYALRSFTKTLDAVGQWIVKVKDVAANKYLIWKRITVKDFYDNTVYLQWLNDYGGLSRRLFDYNSDVIFQIGDQAKYLMLRLYAEGIRTIEWHALNELVREGQIYNDSRRIGQFAQDITDLATPYDVIVQPTSGERRSRQVSNRMAVEIRYPAIPNNEIT